MLVQFTVGNYLSFKEKVTLSMVKNAMHELPENVSKINDDIELLKSVVVYGANASGKTNLIKALSYMRFFTIASFKFYQSGEETDVNAFMLNEVTKDKPSFFEVVLLIENNIYRYGFELDNKIVHKEWLYKILKTTEKMLFQREKADFKIAPEFSEGGGKDKETMVRENCLFLSLISQLNGEISSKIVKKFMQIHTYLTFPAIGNVITSIEKDPALKEEVLKFISIADRGITDFQITPIDVPPEPTGDTEAQKGKKGLIKKVVSFVHKVFNERKENIGTFSLGLDDSESFGTRKLFALSVPVIRALRSGGLIAIDELENHMHPLLFKYMIKLFNSDNNKNNAQLIFSTHNLTCMNNECFRRDQIWFTEKNNYNESSLFSLADYKIDDKKTRKDATYDKNYLLGKYGAVPFIDEIALSFEEKDNELSSHSRPK